MDVFNGKINPKVHEGFFKGKKKKKGKNLCESPPSRENSSIISSYTSLHDEPNLSFHFMCKKPSTSTSMASTPHSPLAHLLARSVLFRPTSGTAKRGLFLDLHFLNMQETMIPFSKA